LLDPTPSLRAWDRLLDYTGHSDGSFGPQLGVCNWPIGDPQNSAFRTPPTTATWLVAVIQKHQGWRRCVRQFDLEIVAIAGEKASFANLTIVKRWRASDARVVRR